MTLTSTYKRRDESPDFLEQCITLCKDDIALFPDFRRAWMKSNLSRVRTESGRVGHVLPHIPSFVRLAIIYEKQGKIPEAVGVCEQATSHGLSDGTKGGFEGRLARLRSKASPASRDDESARKR